MKYIEGEVDRLQPEIELLNPAEGLRRLQPLEKQVEEKERQAKSLNVEYKMSKMKEMSEEAKEMQTRGRKAVEDMNKVGREMARVTSDMREISDGLGSGVTPEQIETSVALGRQWLEEIKMQDFSEERDAAIDARRLSNELVDGVKDFSSPVESFKANVTAVNDVIVDLKFKFEDLKNHSMATMDKIREANAMNFRNSDPPARYRTIQINAMIRQTEANNKMGGQLVNEADELLNEAADAYRLLEDVKDQLTGESEGFNAQLEADALLTYENEALLANASQHAVGLEMKAQRLQNTLSEFKSPGSRALDAAIAFETIRKAIDEARGSAEKGLNAAEEASSMVINA